MRILVFGSSIEYGAWDSRGGWVDRLKQHLHARSIASGFKEKVQLLNLGIGGDTSTKILARMEHEIEARVSDRWPFTFVFSAGTNDQRCQGGILETKLDQYGENVQNIIKIARRYTSRFLFKGLPPLATEVVSLNGSEFSDQRIRAYEDQLRAVLLAEKVIFVPIRAAFEAKGLSGLFSADGLHPNDAGHELIAECVRPEVDKLLKVI